MSIFLRLRYVHVDIPFGLNLVTSSHFQLVLLPAHQQPTDSHFNIILECHITLNSTLLRIHYVHYAMTPETTTSCKGPTAKALFHKDDTFLSLSVNTHVGQTIVWMKLLRDPIFAVFVVDWQTMKIKSAKKTFLLTAHA